MTLNTRQYFHSTLMLFFVMTAAIATPQRLIAGDHCSRCGCSEKCQRVCRIVKEDKKITTTCWGIKSEEFCVGGPSCEKCEQSECVCGDEKDCKEANARPKKWTWKIWEPSACADIMTKKKLMKKTVTKTIPSFKWVVEDLCAACKANSSEERK